MKISQFIQQFPQCPWCQGAWSIEAGNGETFSFVKKYHQKVSCQNCEGIIGLAGKDGELSKIEMQLDQGYSLVLRLKRGESFSSLRLVQPSPYWSVVSKPFTCQTVIQHRESGTIVTTDNISLETWMKMAKKNLIEQVESYLLLI